MIGGPLKKFHIAFLVILALAVISGCDDKAEIVITTGNETVTDKDKDIVPIPDNDNQIDEDNAADKDSLLDVDNAIDQDNIIDMDNTADEDSAVDEDNIIDVDIAADENNPIDEDNLINEDNPIDEDNFGDSKTFCRDPFGEDYLWYCGKCENRNYNMRWSDIFNFDETMVENAIYKDYLDGKIYKCGTDGKTYSELGFDKNLIKKISKSVGVIIHIKDDRRYYSGTMVSKDLFLTAGHAVYEIEKIKGVTFGYEKTSETEISPGEMFEIEKVEINGLEIGIGEDLRDLLDYAVVRLKPKEIINGEETEYIYPGEKYGHATLGTDSLNSHADAVAFIGHPGNNYIANDNEGIPDSEGLYFAKPLKIDIGNFGVNTRARAGKLKQPKEIQKYFKGLIGEDDFEHEVTMFIGNVDSSPLSSGSGVFDKMGNLIGVTKNNNCFHPYFLNLLLDLTWATPNSVIYTDIPARLKEELLQQKKSISQ